MHERPMSFRAERNRLVELLPDGATSKCWQTQQVSFAPFARNFLGLTLSASLKGFECNCFVQMFILELARIKALAKVFYLMDRTEILLRNNIGEIDPKFELQDYRAYPENIWEQESERVLNIFLDR